MSALQLLLFQGCFKVSSSGAFYAFFNAGLWGVFGRGTTIGAEKKRQIGNVSACYTHAMTAALVKLSSRRSTSNKIVGRKRSLKHGKAENKTITEKEWKKKLIRTTQNRLQRSYRRRKLRKLNKTF